MADCKRRRELGGGSTGGPASQRPKSNDDNDERGLLAQRAFIATIKLRQTIINNLRCELGKRVVEPELSKKIDEKLSEY
jgi:hypothetical protein